MLFCLQSCQSIKASDQRLAYILKRRCLRCVVQDARPSWSLDALQTVARRASGGERKRTTGEKKGEISALEWEARGRRHDAKSVRGDGGQLDVCPEMQMEGRTDGDGGGGRGVAVFIDLTDSALNWTNQHLWSCAHVSVGPQVVKKLEY